jgi:putative phosphoribosyl transferase
MRDTYGRLRDREEAGEILAERLAGYAAAGDVVVLGLPRGGVVVAYEVARALNAPLDVFMVRKLGVPGHEELAAGAIASGGARVVNEDVVRGVGLDKARLDEIAAREQAVLERREQLYRGHSAAVELKDKQVIVVDDGLATGATMRTAVAALRQQGPARIVVAVPTAPAETCQVLAREADEVVCAMSPTPFFSIGEWYVNFDQTSDEQVVELLERASGFGRADRGEPGGPGTSREGR